MKKQKHKKTAKRITRKTRKIVKTKKAKSMKKPVPTAKPTKRTVKKTPVSREKVINNYKNLQVLFKQSLEKARENKDENTAKKLQQYKTVMTESITNFNQRTLSLEKLSRDISGVTKILQNIISPTLSREALKLPKQERKEKSELLEKYDLEVDGAKVTIEIRKYKLEKIYNLVLPEINQPTQALLNEIRDELISVTSISMKELTDPKAFQEVKGKFMEDAVKLVKEKLPNIEEKTQRFLVGNLIQTMLGLGKIEYLVSDPNLEEIVIVSSREPIRIYSKKYGWLITNITIKKEDDIINYSNIIARRVGRQITVLNPLLDAHLVTGDRINAVLYPINTKGNTITIRKFARDPFTIIDLINNGTCDLNIAALLWLAVEYEMNVIISGGTASGKTVFLNALMPFIPPSQRIISIEDTRELMLPDFLYWTPLVTRLPNPEGKGGVSMLDLLLNSLRMRPDRIILGEMRKHEEAMVLFEAMHTGHSVYATLHADSAAETISRLVNPPLNIPANLLKAVNLNVVMFRDRRKGIRKVFQLEEIEASANQAKANILYRWSPEEDKIKKHGESSRFYEDLNRHTGMSETAINKTLDQKKKILSWLIKHNIRQLQDLGKVMNYYYRNIEILEKAIEKDNPQIILGNKK